MSDWGDYTPGPWVYNEDAEGLGYVQGPLHDAGHYFNLADTRLISKAYLIPRLEAALEELAVYQDSLVGVRTDARALLAELRSGL